MATDCIPSPRRQIGWLYLLVILLVAGLLAVSSWPQRYEVRHGDEVGYLLSSLMLVEGLPPSNKPAPAGPETWIGWGYANVRIVADVVHPPADMPTVSLKIRPFFAMTRVLFDLYRDVSGLRQIVLGVNVALFLLAVAAGFAYGQSRGGLPAAVLVGGLAAMLPLFVSFAVMSRPYSMAWSFGMMAVWAASREQLTRRATYAGILFGLAVGSRIEMLAVTPLLLWEFWDGPPADQGKDYRCRGSMLRMMLVAMLTAYAVAPWLLTGLPGNLRAIGTIQAANPTAGVSAGWSCMREILWSNGLGPALALFVVGAVCMVWRPAVGTVFRRQLALVVIVLALFATILKSTGYGPHHKGSVIVVFVLGCASAMGAIVRRFGERWAWIAVGLALLLPAIQVTRYAAALPRNRIISLADWVETHVPAGRDLYVGLGGMKVPLPTPQTADLLWSQVTDANAWRLKFSAGLNRFGIASDQLPRAMSEENLVQERGNRRRWFLLGSELDPCLRRYPIHLIHPGPIFPVQDADLAAEFARTGGVVLWENSRGFPPPSALGTPSTEIDADGDHLLVFCSPELVASIRRQTGVRP